jgi:chromosome segregation ATPase
VSHTEDLKKIDRVIKDAEIRIKTMKTSIDAIDKELISISVFRQTLEDNVKCLKTNKVIALATEYKKAKEELKRTKFRIGSLENDRKHFASVLKEAEILLRKSKEDIEKLNSVGDNNVLQFPGKKDG